MMQTDADTSNQAQVSPEPLRTDEDGKPVYAEWDDEWSVPFAAEGEPTPNGGEQWAAVEAADPREVVQNNWDAFRRKMAEHQFEADTLLDGVEKIYSTSQVARFFGRTPQWVYWGLDENKPIFTYKDGTPIRPDTGKNGWRRFTLPLIREIALSVYRRGNMTEEDLQGIMAKVLIAEFGEQAFT
jgi:hypothetical protein